MKPIVIRDMEQSYLVIQMEHNAVIGFQQKMVMNNQISGFLSVEQRQIDEVSKYYYNVTDKVSMQDFYAKKKKVSCSDVQFVFENIMEIVQGAKRYLLEQDNFILRPDSIFFNMDGTKMFVCFYEWYHVGIREQLIKIAEYFMEAIDYKEQKGVTLTYSLYKVLRDESCSFGTLKETINRQQVRIQPKENKMEEIREVPISFQEAKKKEIKPEKKSLIAKKSFLILCNFVFLLLSLKSKWIFYHNTSQLNVSRLLIMGAFLVVFNAILSYGVQYVMKRNNVTESEEEYEKELYQGESENTVVITNYNLQWVLEKEGGMERIHLFTFPFILGSSRESADGILQYPGISKRHCIIESQQEQYQIIDLGSTNGTFLNGELLNPMESYVLKEGDKITIANHTYDFIKI